VGRPRRQLRRRAEHAHASLHPGGGAPARRDHPAADRAAAAHAALLRGPPEGAAQDHLLRPMAQLPVEMILVRQLAGYLFVPVLLVDTTGTVVFYNEPAERILGVRFEETGRIGREEADRLVELTDDPAAKPGDAGAPLGIALEERRPAYAQRLMLRRSDRVRLQIEV